MNLSKIASALGLIAAMSLFVAACSDDAVAEPSVDDVWARPGAQGDNSAVYMAITNDDDSAITLTGASSDVAGTVEVHESQMDDGMMRMEETPELVIEAGETVMLEPGGLHVMMMNLEQDLNVDDTFTITLHFDDLDDIELEATVAEQ